MSVQITTQTFSIVVVNHSLVFFVMIEQQKKKYEIQFKIRDLTRLLTETYQILIQIIDRSSHSRSSFWILRINNQNRLDWKWARVLNQLKISFSSHLLFILCHVCSFNAFIYFNEVSTHTQHMHIRTNAGNKELKGETSRKKIKILKKNK